MTARDWTPATATALARLLPVSPLGGYELLWRGGQAVLVWVDWTGRAWPVPEA